MKLRIRGDTVRLRLTKPEVARLAEVGLVEDATAFPGSSLRYALELGGDAVTASFIDGRILVRVPADAGRAWCHNEEVGIGDETITPKVLVEKDWSCVKPRSDEDPAEMYPHPLAESKTRS